MAIGGAGGAGGTAGAGGMAGPMVTPTAGAAGMAPSAGPGEPVIPEPKSECMPFKSGDMTFAGSRVRIWAGDKKEGTGWVVIYWYATGGSIAEVNQGIPAASITSITNDGGIIAAMYTTTGKGMNTGDDVWYTGDFDVTDEVIGCAKKIHDIDPHHIHALGWSAGGLQSGWMMYGRANYIASVAPYSGGALNMDLQNPNAVPNAILFHGLMGVDQVIIDFAQFSARMGADTQSERRFRSQLRSHGCPT